MLTGPTQCVEHAGNPIIIRINKRIVENNRYYLPPLGKHCAQRQPHQDCDLLPGTVGKAPKRFGLGPTALKTFNPETRPELEFCPREEVVEKWLQMATYGRIVAILAFT